MTINSINNLAHTQQIKDVNSNSDKKKVDNKQTTKDKVIVDKFDKSEVKPEATYKKPVYKKDEQTISQIKTEVDQIHSNLKSLVESLLKKQGMTFKDLDANGPDKN